MKKISIAILIAWFLTLGIVTSEAAMTPSDSVTVKVKVTSALSVSITEGSLTLSDVEAGGITASLTGVTVTNNGSGVNETYSLSLTNPTGWTAVQDAAGVEKYILNAAFSNAVAGITWSNANHALSTIPVACSATKFAGDQTGAGVPYNAARKLWFQFKAPTATSASTEQIITVTVTAQAG